MKQSGPCWHRGPLGLTHTEQTVLAVVALMCPLSYMISPSGVGGDLFNAHPLKTAL